MPLHIHVVERPGPKQLPELRWTGPVRRGQTMTVGRQADLIVGVNPFDRRVSRHAATITAVRRGWRVVPANRHGVSLYPWAQPTIRVTTEETIVWPRVGVRIFGEARFEHWVLLEDNETPTRGAGWQTTGSTDTAEAVRALTPAQREAVGDVFFDLLAWPPRPAEAQVLTLQKAASLLDRSTSAVRQRLMEVRRRAEEVGLSRQIPELTDPEYVYALVKAGLIEPSPDDLRRPLR